jgi:hypothetical protein
VCVNADASLVLIGTAGCEIYELGLASKRFTLRVEGHYENEVRPLLLLLLLLLVVVWWPSSCVRLMASLVYVRVTAHTRCSCGVSPHIPSPPTSRLRRATTAPSDCGTSAGTSCSSVLLWTPCLGAHFTVPLLAPVLVHA